MGSEDFFWEGVVGLGCGVSSVDREGEYWVRVVRISEIF